MISPSPVPVAQDGGVHLDAENPWPGLVSYGEEHAAFFFGRDGEADELCRRVTLKVFTLLFGQSGLGKTSLLNACLYPRLRAEGFLPIDLRLDFKSGEPLEEQAIRQAAAIVELELPGTPTPEPADGLWFWLHRADVAFRLPDGREVIPLLVFDQFEEFFTIGAETEEGRRRSEAFLDEIADLAENRTPAALSSALQSDPALSRRLIFGRQDYRILISMREDYVAYLDSLAPRMRSVGENRMRLLQMNGIQALQAVNNPGARIITPAVSRQIVRFVAVGRRIAQARDGPRESHDDWEDFERLQVEPSLLSLVCRELNHRRQQRGLPQIAADLLAGPNALELILREFYQSCIGDQPLAVRVFVEDRLLTKKTGYRDTMSVDAAEEYLKERGADPAAISLLVNRRLLRFEERLEVRRVELAHDVLAGVVRTMGEERRAREATERAEQARREEKKLRRQAEIRERRARRQLVVAILLLLVAVAGAAFGFYARALAKKSEDKAQRAAAAANEASKEATQAAAQARRTASQADFDLGAFYWERGDIHMALAHLARSVRIQPDNRSSTALLCSILKDRAWIAPLCRPMRHDGPVGSASFSPDGTRIVTGSNDGTARVWDAQSGRAVTEPMRHGAPLRSASFSADGTRIVTASKDGTAQVWDAQSGKPVAEPMRHEGWVVTASFSVDGTRIVTASMDGTARIWDARSGKAITKPMRHEGWVHWASFSADGTRMVTASGDGTARVWDAHSGEPLGEPMRHEGGPVISARFSPDATRVVTAAGDGTARVWHAQNSKAISAPMHHEAWVVSANFSPDGIRIATASTDGTARVWDAESGKPVTEPMRHEGRVLSANFSPDGTRIVTASFDKTAMVWDAQSGKALIEPIPHEDWVLSASFNVDGSRIVTACEDNAARVWDARSGRALSEPLRHDGPVRFASFSPDGARIATASQDGTARVWDSYSGNALAEPMRHDGPVRSANFSSDGRRIVTASNDGTARVWDAQNSTALTEPMRHEGPVRFASFSPNGRRIVTASEDGTARVWDGTSAQLLTEPMRHGGPLRFASFSPDGVRIVTASEDNTARVWDSHSAKALTEPMPHEGWVVSASFSPHGTRIVTASEDNSARVWDAQSGKLLAEPMRHEGPVISASFSPDGARIVTASGDATARIWDAQSGKALIEPMRHEVAVASASFSPDGTRIVTASEDDTARIWDAQSGKALTEPMRHEGPVIVASFNSDGTRIVTASRDKTARVWDARLPQGNAPEWFAEFAETVGRRAFDANGLLRQSPEDLVTLRRRFLATNAADEFSTFARWFCTRGSERAISPFSSVSLSEFVRQRIESGTRGDIQEAFEADPANPEVLANLALFEDSAERAFFLANYAAQRAPENPKVQSLLIRIREKHPPKNGG
jgi:WD40 repeat protein